MKLVERITQGTQSATTNGTPRAASIIGNGTRRSRNVLADGFQQLKLAVHNRLFETLDVSRLESLEQNMAAAKVTQAITEILTEEGRLLTEPDRLRLVEEIKNELLGLGPLEPLLWDESISDILVNGPNRVYIEREGKLYLTEVRFNDDQHLMLIIDRIVSQVGRRVDEASPMVDARLPDGSRINAIIPPLALDGPSLSIRRFGRTRLQISDLIDRGTLTSEMADFINAIVKARLNILVCGGTGSGKTTMLNCMSAYISPTERIVTIEDSAELMLQQPHVVRLETRPPNVEGKGEVTQRELVKNCLRMRPDRIIVGEARGAEVFDMLQAMSTGHDGSICTLHANTPRDAIARLEMMMLLSGASIPQRAMRQQIASALNIVVHLSRLPDGSRKVMRISEITGMEGDTVMMQDLFEFKRSGLATDGGVNGEFRSTGIRSMYTDRVATTGHRIEPPLNTYR